MYYVVSVAVGANIFLEDATVTVSAHFVENSTDFCDDSTDSRDSTPGFPEPRGAGDPGHFQTPNPGV